MGAVLTVLCCKLEIKLGYSGRRVEFLKTKLLSTGQSEHQTEVAAAAVGKSCSGPPDAADYPVTASYIFSKDKTEVNCDKEDG